MESVTPPDAARPMSSRMYARLLRAYPAEFRVRYAQEMVVLFADQIRDARSRGGSGVAITWIRMLADLASSALGEHMRRNRTVAQSLASFEPTRTMRWLGLLGALGGALLIVQFVTFAPFETLAVNLARLIIFALGGAAVAIAFHRRQAAVAPVLATVAAAAVATSGASYAVLLMMGLWVPMPFPGLLGVVSLAATGSLFLSATLYGAAMLKIGRAWQGMAPWLANATRMGAITLAASGVAILGDDRLGVVDGPNGPLWSTIAQVGALLNGVGWVLLGSVLVLAGRRTRPS